MSAFTADPFDTRPAETEDADTNIEDTEAEDLYDDTDESEETDRADASGAGSTPGGAPKSKQSRPSQRPLIRRTVKKTLDVLAADPEVLKLTAAILGHAAEDTEQIVIAILTADRRAVLQPVADLREIRAADQLEMGIYATALGRDRLRDLWALLDLLGRADGTLPSSDPKAALKVVKSVVEVNDDDMTLIDLADELLKKA